MRFDPSSGRCWSLEALVPTLDCSSGALTILGRSCSGSWARGLVISGGVASPSDLDERTLFPPGGRSAPLGGPASLNTVQVVVFIVALEVKSDLFALSADGLASRRSRSAVVPRAHLGILPSASVRDRLQLLFVGVLLGLGFCSSSGRVHSRTGALRGLFGDGGWPSILRRDLRGRSQLVT